MLFLILILVLHLHATTVLSQPVESLPGFAGKLPFKLETGYVGVGDSESVQLFYYFTESESNPKEDPLVLWLTGGPGCSALSGLIYEVGIVTQHWNGLYTFSPAAGPLSFDYTKTSGKGGLPTLKLNPYSWTKVANMIFLDAPVGTGFSYATNSEAYEVDDTISATQIYEFLQKWLLSHPHFLKNPLYVTGDSYSGIIIPIVVQMISDGNEAGHRPLMNLKGYTIGNPLTDQSGDANWRIPFIHRTAIISNELYESLKKNCKGEYVNVDPRNGPCLRDISAVSRCTWNLFMGQILEPNCADDEPVRLSTMPSKWDPTLLMEDPSKLLLSTDSQHNGPWCRSYNYVYIYEWANDGEVQNAIHVRKGSKDNWMRCNGSLSYTYNVENSVPYHKNLTKKDLKSLIYSGDHDAAIPYVGTVSWIKSLNLTLSRHWQPWYADGQVGGYTMQYTQGRYSLSYATVKGGGHTAPEYKPKECLAMLSRWLARSSV